MMHRNKSVNVHQFAMIPRADIPRSKFDSQKSYKTTFDAGYLIPVYVDEVLPGDTINLQMTAFARLATPLFPIMDNMHLDSFFFFVPNRLVWENWQKFMGERYPDPDSSIDYTVPEMTSPAGGYAVNSLQDYMGLPTAGQITGANTVTHCAFWTRAYNLIWNEWFRDQNLQDSPHKDFRRARAAAVSIIPTTTGAAKAISKIFPHLQSKLGGSGIRVPVSNGSLTDITCIVEKEANVSDINNCFFNASQNELKGILEYTNEPIVSVDVIGNTSSCIFDSQLTSVIGNMVKIVGWYDNEMGYSSRLVDLILLINK